MLLDRTKIYGWSEKEALINEKNGVPCPNLKSDFDDWLTDDLCESSKSMSDLGRTFLFLLL